MKKGLALILALAMLCMTLTGCMAVITDIAVFEDGSGTYTVSAGYTENGLELLASMEGSSEPVSTEGLKSFTHNGITYYGETATNAFASLEELNKLLNGSESEEDVTANSGVDFVYQMEQTKDGVFTFTVIMTKAETEDTVSEEEMDAETKQMYDELVAEMAAVLKFTFPSEVTQTVGATDGIKIEKNHLTVDCLVLGQTGTERAVFTTAKDAVSVNKSFDDVLAEAWYYDAVTALADGGLVAGIGNNLFAPDGALTYAQFCQILARAKGLPTGAANDYWAYTAIESCLDAGYVLDRGPVTAANFDAEIPREAAVSAMYLAKRDSLTAGEEITASDIPDFESISSDYRENVLAAYNSGITTGTDAAKTFLPKNTLTRAQVCQLFYNLGWTTAD